MLHGLDVMLRVFLANRGVELPKKQNVQLD